MIHWDLIESSWTLHNLTDDLRPAMARSYRFEIVCVAAKSHQLNL